MDIYLTEEQLEVWEATKLQYDVNDWREWKKEHTNIFGHVPQPNFETREGWDHPLHLAFTRAMNGGNVQQARPELMPRGSIVTQDDAQIDPRFGSQEYLARLAEGWGDAPREIKE